MLYRIDDWEYCILQYVVETLDMLILIIVHHARRNIIQNQHAMGNVDGFLTMWGMVILVSNVVRDNINYRVSVMYSCINIADIVYAFDYCAFFSLPTNYRIPSVTWLFATYKHDIFY